MITLTYKKGQPVKPDHPFDQTRGRQTIERASGGKGVLKYDTWVSQPSESAKACKGGYPFIGMGWTYNWNPYSKDHYGISEYVVKQGAPVQKVRVLTPQQFCKGG